MFDQGKIIPPPAIEQIAAEVQAAGFTMSSDTLTGSLLRTLATTKPAGAFLELGTGMGMGTAWILEGMDEVARLTTVDSNERNVEAARRHLGHDTRVTFSVMDGAAFIRTMQQRGASFDFIFADTWPGKFSLLDETLSLLRPGGFYIIDDLLPQPGWDEEHKPKVARLVADLEQKADLHITKLNWSTGLLIAAKARR